MDKNIFMNSCTILNDTLAWDISGNRDATDCIDIAPDTLYMLPHTEEMLAAAENTLLRRLNNGGGHTGWSRAWIICLWARMRNAERAWADLLNYFENSNR